LRNSSILRILSKEVAQVYKEQESRQIYALGVHYNSGPKKRSRRGESQQCCRDLHTKITDVRVERKRATEGSKKEGSYAVKERENTKWEWHNHCQQIKFPRSADI
jgi:hypothetical protein